MEKTRLRHIFLTRVNHALHKVRPRLLHRQSLCNFGLIKLVVLLDVLDDALRREKLKQKAGEWKLGDTVIDGHPVQVLED
jgi:hypothetical protein